MLRNAERRENGNVWRQSVYEKMHLIFIMIDAKLEKRSRCLQPELKMAVLSRRTNDGAYVFFLA